MSHLTNPEDLTSNKNFKGLIYGQPGIGKSTFALSAPNPVCIDVDRGIHRVEPQFRVPSIQVESYKQVLEFLQGDEVDGFDTIIIDTLGKLVDRIGGYLSENNPKMRQSDGSLTMKGWGSLKIEFQKLFKLLESKNKSIIFVAHEKEESSKDSLGNDCRMKRPDVAGSSGKDIVKELDFMGYMEIRGGRRMITFSPQENLYAKNSMGLNEYIEVPDTKTGNIFISDKIVKMNKERLTEQAALREDYNVLLSTLESEIGKVANEKEANEYFKTLSEMNHIWDTKFVSWSLLKQRAESIGLAFNSKAKVFEINEKEPEEEKPEQKGEDNA